MRDVELIKELRATGKDFFTLPDLEKVTGLDRESLYVSLHRLLKRGTIERAVKGIYVVPGSSARVERIAGQLHFPCYLSFESALSRFGVLNMVPYSLTFATTNKTKAVDLLGRRVDYRRIKEGLFFGFDAADGYYIAKPEKALLDLIYLATLGKATIPVEELDLRTLSPSTLREFAERFPPRVARRLEQLP
jgi:predicted transcriptional regulator of viral defense system